MRALLDHLDICIIRSLQSNARRSNIEVAREIGVAEGTIRHRLQRLVRDDIVRFVALVDPLKTGYETVAIVGVKVNPARHEVAAEGLAAMPEVRYVSYAIGDFDLLIEVLVTTPQTLFEFLTRRLAKVRGVTSFKTFMTPKIVKRSYDWPPVPVQDGKMVSTSRPRGNQRANGRRPQKSGGRRDPNASRMKADRR